MTRLPHRWIVALGLALLCLPAWRGSAAEPLVLDRTIPLHGVAGRIDHMAIDLARRRLFVAELGNGTVDAIDLAAGTASGRIGGLKAPQGVGYVPGADMLAVANGGDGTVRLFHAADLSPAGAVALGDDADNVRVDPKTGTVVVGYGNGGLAAIDPRTGKIVSRIALPVHPEGFELDPGRQRIYVNLPDARQIAIVDTAAGRQATSWRSPDVRGNFPMALDAARGTLAVGVRSSARLVVFAVDSGTPIATLKSCGDADDVFFDAKRRRIYMSCGDGTIDVWRQEAGTFLPLASIRSRTGARTALFVPELDRLFVAARAGLFGLASDAAILVFRPAD